MSRLLADPLAVEVEARDGVPVAVVIPGARRVRRAVTRILSRWRAEADWWRQPVSREYWKVELDERPALLCEIYLDRLGGGWSLSRVYD